MPANLSIRKEIVGIVLVIVFAVAAGFVVSVLQFKGYMPAEYALPIYAIIVLVAGYAWIMIVTEIIEKIVEPTLGVTRAHGIKNIFYVVAAIILIVVISAIFNFNLTGILVGAGFAGIVLGLAAQQVLGNIFGGLSLLASRPFDIGDRITIVTPSFGLLGESYSHEALLNGFTGVVTDITIFFTKMDLDSGTPAVLPNSVVVGSMAVNHSKISLRSVRVRMDLDKRVDFITFKRRFLEEIKKFDDVDPEKSQVQTVDVGANTYQVVMIVWTRNRYEEPVKTVIIQNAIKIQTELTPPPPAKT
jgi:small conductance mechanosensitive channel